MVLLDVPQTPAGDRLRHLLIQHNGWSLLGRYDVTVLIDTFEPDREIAWMVRGAIDPPLDHVYGYRLEPGDDGTVVTSYYDWSKIAPQWREADIFPILPESALRATLGILDRTVRRGYPRGDG